MALTNASLPAKRRILAVCVKLFLEQGYKKTTVAEIVQKAEVSNSSFQNIFRAKDGVLTELVAFMFSSQFGAARTAIGEKLPPVYVYAAETAIQLTLTELNENLRGYQVPEEEIRKVLAFLNTLDIRTVAQQIMERLFHALEMRYDFRLGDLGDISDDNRKETE